MMDGLNGYNFLSGLESLYTHFIYNYGHGSFGIGLDFQRKRVRVKISKLNNLRKFIELLDIFNCIRNTGLNNLFDYNNLLVLSER